MCAQVKFKCCQYCRSSGELECAVMYGIFTFNIDIRRLIRFNINAVCSNKETPLRRVISNFTLTSLTKYDRDLCSRNLLDDDIGMTKNDMMSYLRTSTLIDVQTSKGVTGAVRDFP